VPCFLLLFSWIPSFSFLQLFVLWFYYIFSLCLRSSILVPRICFSSHRLFCSFILPCSLFSVRVLQMSYALVYLHCSTLSFSVFFMHHSTQPLFYCTYTLFHSFIFCFILPVSAFFPTQPSNVLHHGFLSCTFICTPTTDLLSSKVFVLLHISLLIPLVLCSTPHFSVNSIGSLFYSTFLC
jgi:hypothetical protein